MTEQGSSWMMKLPAQWFNSWQEEGPTPISYPGRSISLATSAFLRRKHFAGIYVFSSVLVKFLKLDLTLTKQNVAWWDRKIYNSVTPSHWPIFPWSILIVNATHTSCPTKCFWVGLVDWICELQQTRTKIQLKIQDYEACLMAFWWLREHRSILHLCIIL